MLTPLLCQFGTASGEAANMYRSGQLEMKLPYPSELITIAKALSFRDDLTGNQTGSKRDTTVAT
jgi:hypothetical protein